MIIAVNCGSSTLKFQCIEMENAETPLGQERRLAQGIIDKIGGKGAIRFTTQNGESLSETAVVAGHGEAIQKVLRWLHESRLLGRDALVAAGHRVVHGGDRFLEPAVLMTRS